MLVISNELRFPIQGAGTVYGEWDIEYAVPLPPFCFGCHEMWPWLKKNGWLNPGLWERPAIGGFLWFLKFESTEKDPSLKLQPLFGRRGLGHVGFSRRFACKEDQVDIFAIQQREESQTCRSAQSLPASKPMYPLLFLGDCSLPSHRF